MAAIVDTQQRFSAAWESFFRTTRRLRARAGGRFTGELSLPQYQLLEALRDTPELSVGELAEPRRRRAAHRHADARLPGPRRLRQRRHSETDRRSVLVRLTAEGERGRRQGARRRSRRGAARCSRASQPEEREQAAVLLGRLSQIMEEQL